MARHSPLLPDPRPVEPGTHPALQEQLRDGLRQAFPVQERQESDARFQALLEALARRVPRAPPSHVRNAAAGG